MVFPAASRLANRKSQRNDAVEALKSIEVLQSGIRSL